LSKHRNDNFDEDDFEASSVPSADQFRRPLRQGEVIPPIPSIYEQLAMAAATSMRPGKAASR
jgi:hypothetical protein